MKIKAIIAASAILMFSTSIFADSELEAMNLTYNEYFKMCLNLVLTHKIFPPTIDPKVGCYIYSRGYVNGAEFMRKYIQSLAKLENSVAQVPLPSSAT